MMQVFSSNMEDKNEEKDKDWFIYQNNGSAFDHYAPRLIFVLVGWEVIKPSPTQESTKSTSPDYTSVTSPTDQSSGDRSSSVQSRESEDGSSKGKDSITKTGDFSKINPKFLLSVYYRSIEKVGQTETLEKSKS